MEKSDGEDETVVDGGDGGDLRGIVIALAKASDGKGMRARGDGGGDESLAVALDDEVLEAMVSQSRLMFFRS